MKTLLLSGLACLFALAIGPSVGMAQEQSALEKAESGWISLFNGTDLDGWKASENWSVKDKELVNHANGGNLFTQREFKDFELSLDFLLTSHCNSGVFLRGRYEIQLLDTAQEEVFRKKFKNLDPTWVCGSLYGQIAPSKNTYIGPEKWNSLNVVIVGNRVTVSMNGTQIVMGDVKGPTEAAPIQTNGLLGPLVLQSHAIVGHRFKNIRIRPIEKVEVAQKPKEEPGKKEGNTPPTFVPLDIANVATVASTRIFNQESLAFPQWGKQTHHGVPFVVNDPDGGKTKNAICLYSPLGAVSSKMPNTVRLGCDLSAKEIHVLGAAGWGVPWFQAKNTLSMVMRVEYADGDKEDHQVINGVHLTDWAKGPDVPGSKNIGVSQVRYFSIVPKRQDAVIRSIEFRKGTDKTSPIVMALTVETPVIQVAQKQKEEPGKKSGGKDDKILMQGTWHLVDKKFPGGKEVPKDDARWHQTLEIDGNVLSLKVKALDRPAEGTFLLTPTDKPKSIDFSGKGPAGFDMEFAGIYDISENTLKLSIMYGPNAKTNRVREFDGPNGGDYFVFKRAAEKVEVAQKPKEEPGKKGVKENKTLSEITADFLPHTPGTARTYDTQMAFPDGKIAVLRSVITQKENGIRQRGTTTRIGSLDAGKGILEGGKVTWLRDMNVPLPSPDYHRIKGDYIEIGNKNEFLEGIQWEPVLKIGAKNGDTWKWEHLGGTVEYKVEFGSTHAGKPAVVIHSTWTEPLAMTQARKYVKGIGEVERISVITFKDGKKQTGIIKLVEEEEKRGEKTDVAQKVKEEPAKKGGDLKNGVFKIDGQLTKDDAKDRVRKNSVHKVHVVKLFAGKSYTIDLVSKDFDAYLRLEDSTGKQLAEDDDSGGFPDARIVFQSPKDDSYRIIATTFDEGVGNYSLTVTEGKGVANDKVPAKFPEPIPAARKLEARVKTISKDNMDQMFTQHLQKVSVSITDKQIVLDFDVDRKNWQPVTRGFSLVVRVFDKDGQYLTHFVTKESFTASPDVFDGWMMVVNRVKDDPPQVQAALLGGFTPKLLEANGNRLFYNVDPVRLQNAAIVEIGFIHVPKKAPF